jgi:hypothetical protein
MRTKIALLLLLPLLAVSPGCMALAVTVAVKALEEPPPELTRHYAVDLETAYAACWAGLSVRGYPTPVDPQPPERGVALIQVHDVTVQVSRLSADLTRVQAQMGGFSNEEVRLHTELFLDDLERRLR